MSALAEVLTRIDSDKLRAGVTDMRAAVREVTEGGEEHWTGPLEGLLGALHEVARVDLCLARIVEGHADAMRIFDQADATPLAGVYGVWASRSAGTGLHATQRGRAWELSGRLRFASGIDLIDRTLAPGWIDDGHHRLFDLPVVDLRADRESWSTAAMNASRSFSVDIDCAVSSPPVGGTNFYLTRPGFVVGGLGPAAVWTGGARGVCGLVSDGLRRFEPNPHQLRRLGLMEHAVWTAEVALRHAPGVVMLGWPAEVVADQVSHIRTSAAMAADVVLAEAPMIVGPGGLSTQRRLARSLADLGIYVRQHHLDSDLTALGAKALTPIGERGR